MSRLLIAAVALTLLASVALTDDKKMTDSIREITADKADKIETKDGSAKKPTKITSAEELEKAHPGRSHPQAAGEGGGLQGANAAGVRVEGVGQGQDRARGVRDRPAADRVHLHPGADGRLPVARQTVRGEERVKWAVK